MKKEKITNSLVRLIFFIVAAELLLTIGKSNGLFQSLNEAFGKNTFNTTTLLKLAIMISIVLAVEQVVLIVLSLIKADNNRIQTMVTIFKSITKYASVIFIICWGLTIVGVNVSTIATSVGIVALVVGFGAESLIEDVITGLFMLLENTYNVGDILEINGFRGTVTNIGIRTTSITDMGGNTKVINNANMKDILNRSNNVSKAVAEIMIPYSIELEELEKKLPQILNTIFAENKDVMKRAPEYLGVAGLGDSGVNLKFCVDTAEENVYTAQRRLTRGLYIYFKKVNVEVPFPQIDVHTK